MIYSSLSFLCLFAIRPHVDDFFLKINPKLMDYIWNFGFKGVKKKFKILIHQLTTSLPTCILLLMFHCIKSIMHHTKKCQKVIHQSNPRISDCVIWA